MRAFQLVVCNNLVRATPQGTITEVALPTTSPNAGEVIKRVPEGITTGPDGNLWFAERNTNSIGRIPPGA